LGDVVHAHEKLKQQKLKLKETEYEKNKAVEGLIRIDSRFEYVVGKKHKNNKRQRERSKQLQLQQQQPHQLTYVVFQDEQTCPKRQRLLYN
jgi:hypothetical protein